MNLIQLVDILARRPVLTRKDLARRYNRDLRTIDRWKADGTLPKAIFFHGPLWVPMDIAEAENAGKLSRALKNTTEAQPDLNLSL
jgi:hypothetical protein